MKIGVAGKAMTKLSDILKDLPEDERTRRFSGENTEKTIAKNVHKLIGQSVYQISRKNEVRFRERTTEIRGMKKQQVAIENQGKIRRDQDWTRFDLVGRRRV